MVSQIVAVLTTTATTQPIFTCCLIRRLLTTTSLLNVSVVLRSSRMASRVRRVCVQLAKDLSMHIHSEKPLRVHSNQTKSSWNMEWVKHAGNFNSHTDA